MPLVSHCPVFLPLRCEESQRKNVKDSKPTTYQQNANRQSSLSSQAITKSIYY